MAASADDIYKLAGSFVAMVTGVAGFIAKIQKRLSQIREVKERGGKPGAFFFLTYTLPQYLYSVALIGCGLLGVVALVGGVGKLLNYPTGIRYLTPYFEEFAYQVLGIAALVFIVAMLNGLSWLVILLIIWIPSKFLPLKQSAAWYNLREFSSLLGEPKPIFINPDGVANVADAAISMLENNPAKSVNFAATPELLSVEERANAALIGCLLEKEHTVRGWPRRNWQPFYAAVAASEVNSTRLVSPAYLTNLPSGSDFYGTLIEEINRRLPEEEPAIPDSPQARTDLSNAVRILVSKYKGSTKNIAFSWWRRKPNLRLAFNRAKSFQPFDAASMVPQFLKLAVRWGTWPDANASNFIYPYASRIALLLFENRAMVTLPSVKTVAFKQSGQLSAYRQTMRRIVENARENLTRSNKETHRKILTDYPTKWHLAAALDFALWACSSQLKGEGERWKIDENGIIARKGNGEGAKEQTSEVSFFQKEE